MRHIYTSIDIGSDTIKVAVCELFNNKLNLLAACSTKSNGIKKGLITDVYEAGESVKKAISEVEEMLGINIKKVITTVPSYFATFNLREEIISFENQKTIDGSDISQLLDIVSTKKSSNEKEIVTILPIDFEANGEKVIDPKGKISKYLKIRAVVVETPKKNIYSVVSLLENIGLEVVDISLGSIGDMNSYRTKDLCSKIGAIINVGYETTTISLYNKAILVRSSTIAMGGKNIDNDISYIYKTSLDEARKIKEKFALAHKKFADINEIYDATDKNGDIVKINQFEVSEIAMSRIEEILVLARKEINLLTKRNVDYIIITGGTSSMNNFSIISQDILGDISSVGKIRMLGVRNNKYSSVIGNIVYFINKLKLKGKEYTMIDEEDEQQLIISKSTANESMLSKVFGYFFNE